MSDQIYRQEAINAFKKELTVGKPKESYVTICCAVGYEGTKQILERLPSAEPEIIHCGDCKYKDDGIDEDGIPFLKCLNGRSYGGTRINDYCSWAERKDHEESN